MSEELMKDKTETIANMLKLAGLDIHSTRVEDFETESVGFIFINMQDPDERVWLEVRSLQGGSVVANHPGLTHEEIGQIVGGDTEAHPVPDNGDHAVDKDHATD